MPYHSAIYSAAFFCVFLCLVANAGLATDNAQSPSPFLPTGLLAHPDESAEEILLRAHGYDMEAIALPVAGYRQGMGGFPQNTGIATAWAIIASEQPGFIYSGSFLQFLSDSGAPLNEGQSAEWLAGCEIAGKSRFAPIFKEAGIFDIDETCRSLEVHKQSSAQWNEEYAATISEAETIAEAEKELFRLIRELPYRPLTDADRQKLRENEASNRVIVFFAATSHDPEQERPDWQVERLFDFIAMRLKDKTDYAQSLAYEARQAVLQHLFGTPEFVLPLIKKAHAGDLEASAALGMQYQSGGMGFPGDTGLSVLWIKHAAQTAEPRYTELRAVQLFGSLSSQSAWAWAKLAAEYGNAAESGRAKHLLKIIEKEHSRGELEKDYGPWLDEMRKKHPANPGACRAKDAAREKFSFFKWQGARRKLGESVSSIR